MSGPFERRTGADVAPARSATRDDRSSSRRPLAVLVVDDDIEDIRLLQADLGGLSRFCAEIAHAFDLREARRLVAERRFDLVICDFWLGETTSIPLIDEIRAAPSGCPVILVSALVNDDIELIGRRAGAAGFLAKADLSPAALDRVIGTLLLENVAAGRPSGAAVGPWLRALLKSLDRVHAASTLALADRDPGVAAAHEFLSEIVANASDLRTDIIDKLIGLERATRGGGPVLFDVVPYLADAERRIRAAAGRRCAVDFVVPAVPILLESSPALFGDLVQGFFATASDAAPTAESIRVAPSLSDGNLVVVMEIRGHGGPAGTDARATAAAETRLFLVETLARAIGGGVTAVLGTDRTAASLALPLRVG